ncbi:hypothetical protein VDGD_04301 [Verticillium dahliae]|nr:hypothetical protein VDGD_04301 [Verticillium dahliae]
MSSTLVTETTSSTISTSTRPPPPLRSQRSTHFSQQLPRTLRKSSSFTNGALYGSSHHAASTPNLNSLYTSHSSRLAPPLPTSSSLLARKGSLAALTPSSLASIPDASESYGLNTVLSDPPDGKRMTPTTPGRTPRAASALVGGDDFVVGDLVDVPGNMYGTVRFIGPVQGKKGTFAGVELHSDFAPRGKNSGDVDGVSYFTTSVPGAGIFLPLIKASLRPTSPDSATSFPFTPTASVHGGGLKMGNQNSTNHTPPTPSVPKFSQSVGPGRAPSPQMKRPRPSLPRPESPVRRLMTPGPRPSIGGVTPGVKPPSRYGSPTPNRFAQSVRGTSGDPRKGVPRLERKPSVGPRSASALGQSMEFPEDDITPMATGRPKTNGSVGSVSSFNSKFRPASRTGNNDDHQEAERLRHQLEERDRQLREQAATLADMESSLTELQTLMENPDALRPRRNSLDDKDSTQLRAILREKNEKIAMLTAEFDAHRADFRSTIDTLEMASTETERVYEKRIEELMQEIRDHESRTDDVDSVAQQLKQLEELVQELEEGLEDARRGEAEARGEVEFLRGEVERTRSELRREREKPSTGHSAPAQDATASPKELEQKEDEIRGLKAIIHSLSRDSIPNAEALERQHPPRVSSFNNKMHSYPATAGESVDSRAAREKMEKEMTDLRAMLDDKNMREEELEREVEQLRGPSKLNAAPTQRSSFRDSRDTVVLARHRESRSPELHKRPPGFDSDAYSTATETSTLWCEICETAGHDVLTCTEMFGEHAKHNGAAAAAAASSEGGLRPYHNRGTSHDVNKPAPLAPLSPSKTKTPTATPSTQILPNPLDSGPVAGKSSGVVDEAKWCALCERDGHDSVDCPFEDAF